MSTTDSITEPPTLVNTYLDQEYINISQAAKTYNIHKSEVAKWWTLAPNEEKSLVGNQKLLRKAYAKQKAQQYKQHLLERAAKINP